MKQEDKRAILKALSAFGNIGFTLASSVLVGLFLGRWIDGYLHTSPWALIIGIFLGVVAGFWSIYKQVSGIK
ncbi:MAG: AtpZ/AtpI family protein [Bacillota bacterium]